MRAFFRNILVLLSCAAVFLGGLQNISISRAEVSDIDAAEYIFVAESVSIDDPGLEDGDAVDLTSGVNKSLYISMVSGSDDEEPAGAVTTVSDLKTVNDPDSAGIYIKDPGIVTATYSVSGSVGILTLSPKNESSEIKTTFVTITLSSEKENTDEDVVFTVQLDITPDTTVSLTENDNTYYFNSGVWSFGSGVLSIAPSIYLNSAKSSTTLILEDVFFGSPVTVSSSSNIFTITTTPTASGTRVTIEGILNGEKLATGRGTINFSVEKNQTTGASAVSSSFDVVVTDDEAKSVSIDVRSELGAPIGQCTAKLTGIDKDGKATFTSGSAEVTDPVILSVNNKPREMLILTSTVDVSTLRIRSSDETVATLLNTGLLQALKPGSATITIEAVSDGTHLGAAALTFPVLVTERALSTTDPVMKPSDLTILSNRIDLSVGKSAEISASATGEISYSSDDESKATVSDEGIVYGISPGVAVISVKALETDEYYAGEIFVTVVVKEVSKKSSSIKLTPTTLKQKKLKKSSAKVKVVIKGSSGKVTIKLLTKKYKGNIKISGKKITFKKGTKKGTCKLSVTVAADDSYEKTTKTLSVKIS